MSEVNRRRLARILGPLLGSHGAQAGSVARDLDAAGVRAPNRWDDATRAMLRDWDQHMRREDAELGEVITEFGTITPGDGT